MRITGTVSINNLRYNLEKVGERLSQAHDMLSSGKSITRPSDDPRKAMTVLYVKNLIEHNRRYQNNIQDSLDWLEATDQALDDIGKAVQDILEAAVTGANNTLPLESRQSLALKLEQTLQHLVQVANSETGGRYLFAGQKTLTEPFSFNQSLLSVSYSGDEGRLVREISQGATIGINITGSELFGPNMELFAHVKALRDAILSANVPVVEAEMAHLQSDLDTVLRYRAEVGARINRLELTLQRLKDTEIEYTRLLSENEDADITGAMVTLKTEEMVYRTALECGARIIQPSLIDYLK
ncbi:MAG TPA: flagellar hook-associated protein FlgL [Firmicutes bacterium]|nr:flagellar hook-associated protein FlgL [Bacillota bacterium]